MKKEEESKDRRRGSRSVNRCPFSVLDYGQESGRAGRDGLRSEQRTSRPRHSSSWCRHAYVGGEGGTATCRRAVLEGIWTGGRGSG